jgi:hypothetical protein
MTVSGWSALRAKDHAVTDFLPYHRDIVVRDISPESLPSIGDPSTPWPPLS